MCETNSGLFSVPFLHTHPGCVFFDTSFVALSPELKHKDDLDQHTWHGKWILLGEIVLNFRVKVLVTFGEEGIQKSSDHPPPGMYQKRSRGCFDFKHTLPWRRCLRISGESTHRVGGSLGIASYAKHWDKNQHDLQQMTLELLAFFVASLGVAKVSMVWS